jgi:hypothetical protein
MVAILCRRGHIQGGDVGSIQIARSWSRVEIAADVAEAFTAAVAAPDPRDPHVYIRPESPEPLKHKKPIFHGPHGVVHTPDAAKTEDRPSRRK